MLDIASCDIIADTLWLVVLPLQINGLLQRVIWEHAHTKPLSFFSTSIPDGSNSRQSSLMRLPGMLSSLHTGNSRYQSYKCWVLVCPCILWAYRMFHTQMWDRTHHRLISFSVLIIHHPKHSLKETSVLCCDYCFPVNYDEITQGCVGSSNCHPTVRSAKSCPK